MSTFAAALQRPTWAGIQMMHRSRDERRSRELMDCNSVRINYSWQRGTSHRDQSSPFDNIVIQWRRLIFSPPSTATVVNHSVKPGGNASQAKSNVRHLDTYIILRNIFTLSREMSFALVMATSPFSSVSISSAKRDGSSSCGTSGLGISSVSCTIG